MTLHSGWLTATGQSRQATRHTAVGAVTPTDRLVSRSGILPGTTDGLYTVGGFWVDGAGAMTATVYSGRAVIQGAGNQGAYPVALDEDTTVTFADGDAQYGRIDLVVVRVYDDAYDASGRTEAVIEIVQGTPAATPAAPAVPSLSLPLFLVTVPAGTSAGTGGIDWATAGTDLRTTVVGVGGILPTFNNASVAGAYPGQYQDNGNAGLLQRWNGSAWVPYPKEIGGIAPSGAVSTAGYTGQFREDNGVLQRWDGSVWKAYQPPVEVETTSTGVTMSTGWALTSFQARRSHGLCTFTVEVTRTGADITSNSYGNITDEPLCTLPDGWRPAFDTEAPACDGYGDGGAVIRPSGLITLRTWSNTGLLTSGRNVRISATYVL